MGSASVEEARAAKFASKPRCPEAGGCTGEIRVRCKNARRMSATRKGITSPSFVGQLVVRMLFRKCVGPVHFCLRTA